MVVADAATQAIVNAIQGALANDQARQSAAAKQLQAFEDSPGFCQKLMVCCTLDSQQLYPRIWWLPCHYLHLLTLLFVSIGNGLDWTQGIIGAHSTFNASTRLMAAVCISNVVKRHWAVPGASMRNKKAHQVPPEERDVIRAQLLAYMTEPDRVIARNLATVLGHIARLDWPRRFPKLIDSLIASIRAGNLLPATLDWLYIGRLTMIHDTTLFLQAAFKLSEACTRCTRW